MSGTAFTAYVVALSTGDGFHPQCAVVEVEHYDGQEVRRATYSCPMNEAPRLGATVKVTVEVQP